MASVLKFDSQQSMENKNEHEKNVGEYIKYLKNNLGIFGELSKRTGVDMDKVIFENDSNETKKMNRNLNKETLIERSKYL